MATGAGIDGQLSITKEVTYGSRQAPAKFFEFNSEGLKVERNRQYSKGIRPNRKFQSSTRVATTTRQAAGPTSLDVPNQGFGTILDLLHGNTVTPVQQGGGAAYLQTHNIGASDPGKSASIQVGKPGTDGTVRPYDYLGALISELKLTCETGGWLTAEISWAAQDRVTNQSLASATYPSNLRTFHFGQCTPTVNGTPVTDVFESVTITYTIPRHDGRYKLGAAGVQAKPILNDYIDCTIEFAGDFKDNTFTSLYDADTIVPVIVDFQGPIIAGTYKEFLTITNQACILEPAEDPTVDGPDVVGQSLTFRTLDNGTNPPSVAAYQSLDVSL